MGWIGWTYDQTLDTPMTAIESAYRGRHDMLRAIFGGRSDKPKTTEKPEKSGLTAKLFAAMFRKTHG